jgi:hypothetical protein
VSDARSDRRTSISVLEARELGREDATRGSRRRSGCGVQMRVVTMASKQDKATPQEEGGVFRCIPPA